MFFHAFVISAAAWVIPKSLYKYSNWTNETKVTYDTHVTDIWNLNLKWFDFFTALQKSKKEKEIKKIEIRKLKDELHDSKEQITAFNLEEQKLCKIIQDGDQEREKQKKEMERVNRNPPLFSVLFSC